MKCNNCGREISDSSNFCVYCGVQVVKPQYTQNAAATGNISLAKPQNAQNSAAMGNMASAKVNTSDKKGKIALIVLVVAIFAVISGIIGTVAFNLVKKYVIPELAGITDTNTNTNANTNINVTGNAMVVADGAIFNSSGAVNEQFKGAEGYEFYSDPEGTVGVIFVEGEVYLIDSELKTTLIDDSCVDVSMNFTGNYVYVATSEKSKLGKGLCVYNTKDNSYNLIEECDIIDSCCITASPDGNTALVSRTDGLFMMGLDGKSENIFEAANQYFNVISVSNDRHVAYFSPQMGEGLFCWKDGNVIKIYDDDFRSFSGYVALNADCKKILFKKLGEGLRYFDSDEMSESKVILSDSHIDAYYKGRGFTFSDISVNYFPEAENFEGMYLIADRSSYWLNSDMEAVCKTDGYATSYSSREFKVYDIEENSINAITYKDGKTQTEELYHDDHGVYDVAVSDDESVMWILLYDKIITYKDGKVVGEALKVSNDGFSIGNIMNDPLSDKAYCISDSGTVFVLDENGNHDEIGKVDNAYGFWDEYSGGKSLISVESEEDTLAYIIYGKIVKKD
ncbi:zinc ribbon domain-containing protein [Butyrivibrio sp. AE2005]|uniref:zinc ribbon domain-containing protein n=1 Tax=Butyrivibrio sp. AE2005 TaxID=1496722 RepID=UPI00047DE2F9|nr:zinc ribbon domain-containing protein [Butyrivibrio sp. AE2005]